MYKWHVHSAIGRGRPLASDFARVTDGIAASLRQFSLSASMSAEDNDGPRISRTQRSAEAFKEVSSLAPTPARGIDARSLAAKPPPTFTIRRVDNTHDYGGGRGGFAPRGRGPPGAHGGGFRGRGGARGRGARGRGRGARRGGPKEKRAPREKVDADAFIPESYSEEELAYLAMRDGGFPANYIPETSKESLAKYGPAVMSSPRGIHESIVNRMMVATDNKDPSFQHGSFHLARMEEGLGTLFEDAEQKRLTEDLQGSRKFMSLSENAKSDIMRQWVAGQYRAPGTPEAGNVLGLARQMVRRNETYLPDDAGKFERKLRSLLPQHMLPSIQKAPRKPKATL
ncbi:uncharacterized protein PAC_05192 [Phialocephala subalpina]|uniref:Uncharacterized protein n=1 Tax=Phialocephala subalpina TaxID=576137 RepID=A0A1L7WRC5_9HELO|nr:uncharacterized protein PAC_05192 [Phialocephala subalpina]